MILPLFSEPENAFRKKWTEQSRPRKNRNSVGTYQEPTRNQPKLSKNPAGKMQSIVPIYSSPLFFLYSFTSAIKFLFLLFWWESRIYSRKNPCSLAIFTSLTWCTTIMTSMTLHKKWSFPLRISSVNATKSARKLHFWCNVMEMRWSLNQHVKTE